VFMNEIRKNLSLYKTALTLPSLCTHSALALLSAANPHGCWVCLICTRCRSVFAGIAPAKLGKREIFRGFYAVRWGSCNTSAPLRSLSRWLAHWIIMARRSSR
jgi:hypothetical protein